MMKKAIKRSDIQKLLQIVFFDGTQSGIVFIDVVEDFLPDSAP